MHPPRPYPSPSSWRNDCKLALQANEISSSACGSAFKTQIGSAQGMRGASGRLLPKCLEMWEKGASWASTEVAVAGSGRLKFGCFLADSRCRRYSSPRARLGRYASRRERGKDWVELPVADSFNPSLGRYRFCDAGRRVTFTRKRQMRMKCQ